MQARLEAASLEAAAGSPAKREAGSASGQAAEIEAGAVAAGAERDADPDEEQGAAGSEAADSGA